MYVIPELHMWDRYAAVRSKPKNIRNMQSAKRNVQIEEIN
jgi:hypothetical protein